MSAENPDIASSGENIENEADTTGHIEDTGYVIPPDGVPSDLPEDARSGGEELGEHEGKGEEPIEDQEKPDEKQDKPGERIENVEGKDKEKGDTTTSDEKRLLSGEIEQLLQDHLMDRLIDGMDMVSLLSGAGEGSDLNLDARIPADVFLSDKCTLDSHYVEIEYSFGYDCGKNFNICCPDPNYLVFLSGCFIHILNISDKLVELRRGSGGQGLGCITKNNTEPHIAIGEKGHNPDIIIYEWPSFNVVSVLRGGSVKQYTCVDYSPKGDILVSQSGEPDHTIGIWDWKQRHVILKVKSHAQDVYNARFSKYVTGHLSSSGLGHIKMWKMVNTFTSLKLLGVIGRFGKTTTCDILAIYPMPDEKVLSGCEWGNILVWDDGMIKIEVSRKNRRPCHADQIVQFLYDPQTLQITTVGADGFIRMWNYQTIDLANPPEEEKFVELEPIFEIEVKEMIFGAQLMHIVESPGTEDCTWFGQDKWGGFWKLHVEVTTNLRPAEKIYVTHTGPIVDMAPSPRGLYLVTVGRYGRLAVWSVLDKKLVLFHDAKPFRITRILWLSTEALKSGCAMVAGLANGLIKLLIIRLKEKLSDPEGAKMKFDETNEANWLHPIQVLKPHTASVTCLASNREGTYILSGSEDKTIFIFAIKQVSDKNLIHLDPIGFVETMGGVSHLYWNMEEGNNVLVSCTNGYSMQIQIPHHIPSRSKLSSYKIPNLHIKVAQFRSVKSKILRDEYLKKVKALKEAKLKRKRKEAEEMKKNNPALEFDEYYFYDSQEEMYLKDLPEEYIPPDPNPILFTIPMKRATDPPSTPEDIVWLSVDGYDAGYLYGISMDKPGEDEEEENEPDIIPLPGMVDVAATCALKVPNSNHLYLGFGNGIIRLVQIDPNAPNHTGTYLQLSTHDHQYGRINKLCMSPDQSHLYSCGDDSNIFSYRINDPARQTVVPPLEFSNVKVKDLDVELPEDIEKSLEEEKQKIRYGNRMAEANRAKQNLRNVLATLQNQLGLILRRLNDIPESIRPSDEDFELDPRITEATIRMAKEPLELIKTKMRYDIEKSKFGFEKLYNYFLRDVDCFYKYVFDTKCERYVTTFVQKKMKQDLESELYNLLMEIESETSVCFKIPEEIKNTRAPSKEDVKESPEIDQRKPSFLKDLESFKHKLPLRTQRALRKYYEGREEIDTQKLSLEEFEKLKPDMGNNHEEEEKPDENADKTVGNYTMKCDPEYRVPKDKRSSVKTKKLQILKTESEIHNLKQQFNQKVLDLLQEKVDLIQEMKQLTHDLKQRQVFIPKKFHQHFPSIPCLNYDLEFPERKFQVDQTTFPDQYEPRNLWTCPELDLLRPPEIIVSPFSEEPSSLNLPDTMSQLNEEENEASQTVFKIHGGEKPSEVPCELPSCATFRMPSVLSHPGLDHLESDVHRSHMFLTTPEISMATLELPSGSSDISTLDLSDLSAISSDMSISDMIDMFKQDQEQSPLEMELAKDTTIRLILEQASIANDLAKRKENFNKKVERLALERFRTAESIKLLELFLLTLNQELIVLDSFKGGENAIQVVIDEQVAAIQSKQAKIIEMGKQIEENDAKILVLKEKIKGIEATFAAFNQNCPKYALLYFKKVFQKKLKIRILKPDKEEAARKITETGSPSSPKKYVEDKDDRSDYTTSSEEEEEEGRDVQAEVGEEGGDGGDDEDGDVWDENSQPPGLNPKMHETVVQLRLRRHEVEEEIATIMNKNDALVKEIEHVTNSITYIKSNMVIRNEELDEIITEKQKKLNEVETTIVLKVSQLKNEDSPLNRCIILPSTQFYWLNNRSYELKKETEAERKQFHECDKTLSKIKSENARLQEQYKKLLGQVNEATIKKYGRLVNVTELEEAVLQALIHEVRMDVPDIIKSLDSDLKRKQTKLEEEEIALLELMKNRNETFQFLATLEAEQLHLEREIAIINSKKKLENNKHKSSQSNYNQDIAKLCGMYDRLKREEVLIMTELCDLTYKGTRPPVKLPPMRKEIKIVKTKPKDTPADRATELKNASKKIKEILEAINSHKLDTDDFSFIVDDLKKLYGLNIKGTENETVDDVVDVMIDLATKKEDSNIGVSNAEVIKATLSMLLLDIEQTESQLNKKDEGHDDAMSVLSDVSGIEEDIIKVSVQPDEGDRVTEVGESSIEEDEDIVRSDIESETKTDDVKDDVEATADLEQEEDIIEDEDVTLDNENQNIDDA